MSESATARRIIKKKIGGHAHHGGAWKVAYADFVTAMMAFFMVMWLLASTDSQSRKEISRYFRTGILPVGDLAMNHAAQFAPSVIEASGTPPPVGQESLEASQTAAASGAAASKIQAKLDRLANFDGELRKVMKNVSIRVTEAGVVIEAVDGDGVLFDVSSAKLGEPLERFLRALAPMASLTGAPVEIYGHTDARPFAKNSQMSNWDLSYARAAGARMVLEQSGLAPEMITSVNARGSSELYVKDDPLAAANRRLTIVLKIAKPADTAIAGIPQPGEMPATESAP